MRVNLLGEPTFTTAEGEERPLSQSPFAHVLLGRLAYARGAVPRSELRRCLWPDQVDELPPSGRDDRLNHYASAVRRALGFAGRPKKPVRPVAGGSIVLDRPGSKDPKAAVKIGVDLDEFREGVKDGTPAALRQALDLVRGPFLATIDGQRFPWLEQARDKVEQECAAAARKLTGQGDAATAAVREFFAAPSGTLLDALGPLLEEREEAPEPAARPASASVPRLHRPRPAPPRPSGHRRPAPSRRSRRRRRILGNQLVASSLAVLFTLAIIAGLGEVADLLTASEGRPGKERASGPSGRAEATAAEMNTSDRYNLAAGLRVANRTLDDRWGAGVEADPTDRLAFALTLENSAPVASYPLVAWTEPEDDPEGGWGQQLRLLIARPNGEVLMETPWVRASGWTNQFGRFFLVSREKGGMAVVRSTSGEPLRKIEREYGSSPYVIPWELRGAIDFERGVESIPIGRLESGRRVLVEFVGSWDVYDSYGTTFGGLDPTFEVDGSSAEPSSIGSVRPGDRLTFFVLLDDQGNFASPARVRVDFHPRKGGRYIEMRAFGSQFREEELIGTTTINSGDGRPIALLPEPGSTELRSRREGSWMYDPECPIEDAPIDTRTLEDGIALGGVDIGEFGGFNPHTYCAGTETTKQLRFEAVVLRR